MRTRIVVLIVLIVGNLLLWPPRLASGKSRGFDFDSFAAAVRELFPSSSLAGKRLADPLLPETNLYLASTAGPLLTVYVGYYPMQGLLAEEPHPPEVCYQVQGWTLLHTPEPVVVDDGDFRFKIQRASVALGTHVRTVYFWRQEAGGLPSGPDTSEGWAQHYWYRFHSGRSDLAWVRVEVDENRANEKSFGRELIRIMFVVSDCMQ